MSPFPVQEKVTHVKDFILYLDFLLVQDVEEELIFVTSLARCLEGRTEINFSRY